MARILLINTNISWNKGSAAQVASTVEALRKRADGLEFALISYCPHLDTSHEQERDVEVIGHPTSVSISLRRAMLVFSLNLIITLFCATIWRVLSVFGWKVRLLQDNLFLREYLRATLVVDLSGDSLSDSGSHSAVNLLAILVAVVLRKPMVLYSQSIGPFSRMTLWLAGFCLNRAKAIVVRENKSREYLSEIGVRSDIIHEFGDCAFALTSSPPESALEILMNEGISLDGASRIGISVSSLVSDLARQNAKRLGISTNHPDPYVSLMLRVTDALTDDGHDVLLIPHVISPTSWMRDDRAVCKEILERVKNGERVWTIRNDYSPEDLKAVIRTCRFFVGSRMHACIASISSNTPTVALGWSHKYDGIMERLDMLDRSFAFDGVEPDEFIGKLRHFIGKMDELDSSPSASVEAERVSALQAVDILLHLIQSDYRGMSESNES